MNAETSKIKNKLSALTASFDELETMLDPIFAQTLPETLVGLEPLQQAKLQTALPYLIYDLIFIYLKSRGIDPKTHPVIPELDRIRQYFEKINNAENPPAKRSEIDKAAANRFIKHAIAQAQWKKTAAESAQDVDNTPTSKAYASASERVGVKMTEKMLERAAYEKELKSRDAEDDEEEILEVFEGEEEEDDMKMEVDTNDNMDGVSSRSASKGKGKEVSAETVSTATTTNKRRRPAIDHFAGVGDELAPESSPATSTDPKNVKSLPTAPSSTTQTPEPKSTLKSQSEKSKTSSKKAKKKAKKSTSS